MESGTRRDSVRRGPYPFAADHLEWLPTWLPVQQPLRGTPLWVVSEVLGHASIALTKDTYGHLLGAEKQEATEAITDALFEPDSGRREHR